MTNGEKMQEIFPEGKTRKCINGVVFESDGWCHVYDSDWWDAEYKEPIPRNDLEVEKAIEIIKADSLAPYSVNEILEARDLAIYALKKMATMKKIVNTSGLDKNSQKLEKDFGESDCISREQALFVIRNLYPGMPRVDFNGSLRKWVDKYKPYIECDDAIKELPSVTPQEPRWIPVSEYLPVTNDEVLVTYIVNGNAKKRYVETANCFDGEWSSVNDEYRIPNTKIEIIAWCEMPKPYEVNNVGVNRI